MNTLKKTITAAAISAALALTSYAVFAEADVPIAATKEGENRVATGVTIINGPTTNASPLVGGWIESKTEDSLEKLKVYRNGAVSMSTQQGQYSGSVTHSLSTGDSSLKLGVGSELGKLSGSVSLSPSTGDSAYGFGIGHGQYSGAVTHSPTTGDSSLKLGVGSELGKFSGSVSHSPSSEDNSYGIGWGLTW